MMAIHLLPRALLSFPIQSPFLIPNYYSSLVHWYISLTESLTGNIVEATSTQH
ncbi:hypothetical protein BT96DRAFT_920699 [Gymnopus androsaceus JB14]|uniref:Uncharacterized protein n=1 Tax=Gymnopus androsaceus JB14 TaxID=1447944 RepID=A0A6A4HIG6_9AGAR|nr:hypothetical protein BT96DRAFT_920699 [Gymnopus androsaceus JB14]